MRILLLLLLLASPCFAGRELDNRGGQYNRDTFGEVEVREPDKEPVKHARVNLVLRERRLEIIFSPEKSVKSRVDQIWATGTRTEITASDVDSDTRFFIKLNYNMDRL